MHLTHTVASKLLGGVLQQIEDKQAKKDSDKFDKLRTQREKRLLLQRAKAVAWPLTRHFYVARIPKFLLCLDRICSRLECHVTSWAPSARKDFGSLGR
jgi:hypothetical protein